MTKPWSEIKHHANSETSESVDRRSELSESLRRLERGFEIRQSRDGTWFEPRNYPRVQGTPYHAFDIPVAVALLDVVEAAVAFSKSITADPHEWLCDLRAALDALDATKNRAS